VLSFSQQRGEPTGDKHPMSPTFSTILVRSTTKSVVGRSHSKPGRTNLQRKGDIGVSPPRGCSNPSFTPTKNASIQEFTHV